MPNLRLCFDYSVHSLEVSDDLLLRIRSGDQFEVRGCGYQIDGKRLQDIWRFSGGKIQVYCDNGYVIYDSAKHKAEIRVD